MQVRGSPPARGSDPAAIRRWERRRPAMPAATEGGCRIREARDDDVAAIRQIFKVVYDDEYVSKADAILGRAESRAQTPEIRQRVATCRS